jgi:pentafunctional AROM polypeptide
MLAEGLQAASYVIVSDDQVYSHYGARLVKAFAEVGVSTDDGVSPRLLTYSFPHGEKSKNRETKAAIEDFMLAGRCTRSTVVVALGGGVVGDMSGFVAATYMRGVPVVQIPTSTMAILDSSVGGKTAINVPAGKNLIGAFHQPRLIFADPKLLETLSQREVVEGLAEAIKMGIIRDAELFRYMVANANSIVKLEHAAMQEVLHKSVAHKADVVAQDPTEQGIRSTLNFGHTIGHAIEALLSPSKLHGECVSIGSVAEADLACRMGHCSATCVDEIRSCLEKFGLPVKCPQGLTVAGVMDKMAVDKKNLGKTIRCTIIKSVGSSFDNPLPVSRELMESVIADMLKQAN